MDQYDEQETDLSPDEPDNKNMVLVSDLLPSELVIIPVYPRPYFPGLTIPLIINGEADIERIKQAKQSPTQVLGLVLVKDPDMDETPDNFYKVGVAAKIFKIIYSDEDTIHLLVNCITRFTIHELIRDELILWARVKYVQTTRFDGNEELKAYSMAIISTLKDLVQTNPLQSEAIKIFLSRSSLDEPNSLTDFAASLTSAEGSELQEVLEAFDLRQRIDKVLVLLKQELELSKLQQKIHKQIEDRISQHQREFFLKEQLKAIKKELGLEKEGKVSEAEKFQERIKNLSLNEDATRAFEEELEKFNVLEPISPEYNVTRNYLDWLSILPWGQFSTDNYNIRRARRILDRDHFGLDDVKSRILEFLAVGKLKGCVSGSILCLVGPPGVGKTSVGQSIAHALGRKLYRFSLGGMRDEAEIKGHRRTYIGAMPGKFIQALKSAGTANPVIMLDEIDKIGASFRGDPASALLEVLDPEQNSHFIDHYMDVPFDLSQVLFVATANQLDTIPAPLLDRMEVIRLSGYILEEKMGIARKYLIPKIAKSHGVSTQQLSISKKTLTRLIDGYAREAGVRRLEQHLKKIFRKAALKIVEGKKQKLSLKPSDLEEFLGNPHFVGDEQLGERPGVVIGLAWTSMGGATLQIEASAVPSKRKGFKQTGQLGDVMIESSEIAYSFVMAHLKAFGGRASFFEDHFIHLHVPAGATPKDGPSAGITMATVLISLMKNKAVSANIAMTGELTLSGRVLPIGGLKEKLIAARRVKCNKLIFPKGNERDYLQLPDFLKEGVQAHFVKNYAEVFQICFPKKG